MKKVLTILQLLLFVSVWGQTSKGDPAIKAEVDLKADINQTAFDKIIASMSIPLTLFEHNDPFKTDAALMLENVEDYEDPDDKVYTFEETKELYKWAVENKTPSTLGLKDNASDPFKNALKQEWENFKKEIDEAIASSAQAETQGQGRASVENYTIDDLKKWSTYDVENLFKVFDDGARANKTARPEAKAHLAYARVDLTDRPILGVNSPNFSVKNIRVKATATGELWVKLPSLKCCRWFGPICTCYRVEWHWKRLVRLTVSPKVGADVTIVFSIANKKIFATGSFDNLFLDYNVLRDINLAVVGNRYMKNKKFELYDVSKFVASVPYINKKFRIQDIKLPARSNGISVDVNVVQTQ